MIGPALLTTIKREGTIPCGWMFLMQVGQGAEIHMGLLLVLGVPIPLAQLRFFYNRFSKTRDRLYPFLPLFALHRTILYILTEIEVDSVIVLKCSYCALRPFTRTCLLCEKKQNAQVSKKELATLHQMLFLGLMLSVPHGSGLKRSTKNVNHVQSEQIVKKEMACLRRTKSRLTKALTTLTLNAETLVSNISVTKSKNHTH